MAFGSLRSQFVVLWREMIEYTLTSEVWRCETYRSPYLLVRLAVELMGFGRSAEMTRNSAFEPVVKEMVPSYCDWMRRWLSHPEAAARLADFLTGDSATPLIPAGIRELGRVCLGFSDYDWRSEKLDEVLSSAVRRCWRTCQDQLVSDAALRQSFQVLLNKLCEHNYPAALELRNQIG